jgi:hypothetical protein
VAIAAMTIAADFTWTGGGGGNADWDLCDNWNTCPSGGYPDDTNDDATIPDNGSSTWQVDIISEVVNTITIEGNVNFGVAEGENDPTVLATGGSEPAITIDAAAGDVTVTIGSGAALFVP